MLLKAITNGSVTGNGTISCVSTICGGVLITTDGTNAVTVVVRRLDANGKKIIQIVSDSTIWISGPFSLEGTEQLYHEVSGTGGAAQFFEWVT